MRWIYMKFMISKSIEYWCIVEAADEERAIAFASSLPAEAWEPSNECETEILVVADATDDLERGAWADKKVWGDIEAVKIDAGLVIAPEWLAKILCGEKTWEIRSKPNGRVARIALAEKGGALVCTCTIGKSMPLRIEEFAMNFDKHRVKPAALLAYYGIRDVYAWPLSDVRPLVPPIKYRHPGGGSWVSLSGANVPEFDRLQAA